MEFNNVLKVQALPICAIYGKVVSLNNDLINSRSGSGGPRITTLRDVAGGGPAPSMGGFGGGGHAHGGSDDEDDEDENRRADQGESWFAGGERR